MKYCVTSLVAGTGGVALATFESELTGWALVLKALQELWHSDQYAVTVARSLRNTNPVGGANAHTTPVQWEHDGVIYRILPL